LRSIKGGIVPKQHSGVEIFAGYQALLSSISELLQHGRQHAAKSVNAVLTTTYWLVGRRLVEYEQGGKERAEYGAELLKRLKSGTDAAILSPVAESADGVCEFRGESLPKDFADTICEIDFRGDTGLLAFMVALCKAPFRHGLGCQTTL